MKLSLRIEQLERKHQDLRQFQELCDQLQPEILTPVQREKQRQLDRMIQHDPRTVRPLGLRIGYLAERGASLAAVGQHLTREECEEGDRIAAWLAERLRVLHAASGDAGSPLGFIFGFKPAPDPPRAGGQPA